MGNGHIEISRRNNEILIKIDVPKEVVVENALILAEKLGISEIWVDSWDYSKSIQNTFDAFGITCVQCSSKHANKELKLIPENEI
jgi:hypothetical protein